MPVRPSYYKHENKRYFRTRASDVLLGSYGEKKSSPASPNYLAIQGQVPNHILDNRVRRLRPYRESWQSVTQADLGGSAVVGFDVAGSSLEGTLQTSFTLTDLQSAEVELVKFVLDEGPLQRMLNRDFPRARNYMSREGNDARIVSSVYIAMSGTLARDFSAGADVTMSATTAGLKITSNLEADVQGQGSLKIRRRTKSVIVLSQGTTFAYGMHKVKRWENRRRQDGNIVDLEDDYQGLG